MIDKVVTALTGEGGLLRVRAGLALGLTIIGGWFLISNEAMPPNEFNILWGMATSYYFATRAG